MTALTKELEDKQKVAAEKNVKDGEKFLAENKTKEGVKTTASGLQYKVIKEGTGSAAKTDRRSGGKLSRNAHQRNGIRQFLQARPARDLPAHWRDQRMDRSASVDESGIQVSAVRSLESGLRRSGDGSDIGPNSALIFEVELVGIQPQESPTPPPGLNPSPSPKVK